LQKEITDFFNEISAVYDSNLPFVVFRKPNEVSIKAYIQNNKELYHLSSFNEQGFVFAPFNKNEKIVVFPVDKCKVLTSKTADKYTIEIKESKLNFKAVSNEKTKEDYVQLVQKGIHFIKNKNAKKVVLSRKESIECDNLDVINTLKKILNNYKNAFVYLWFHPSIGLWMGATPERLINVSKSIFKTMALAGTQLYVNSKDVVWNEKEKKEQQFVTDFILENIKETIDNIRISDAYTVKAGNLLHIRTDISGNLKTPNLLGILIDTLHPTPAVLGLPKNMATKFILDNEGYKRAYYSGYLGELNIDKSTNLFVNLRCMQLNKNTASIYIGGGITIDSNSIKEWEETVSKSEVMKNVL
jgi:isochorismate synthase